MGLLTLLFLPVALILAAPSEIFKDLTLTNNEFSADIYKLYKEDPKVKDNFVICPLSLKILLAVLQAGADGKTAEELSTALNLPHKREAIDKIFHELHPLLQVDDKYTLQSANKIYLKNGYSPKEQYKGTAVDIFGASIQNINFDQKKAAVSEINGWIDEQTHHKIQKFVTENDITPDIVALLLNAIYFKGKWVDAFNKSKTSPQPFYLTKKSFVNVEMMDQTEMYRYSHNPELRATFLELPYKGDNVTMILVLPDDVEGLKSLEEDIRKVVKEPESSFTYTRIRVRMPKYKIETFLSFTSILQKLGIVDMFSHNANFKRMLNEQDEGLYISKIYQKAVIETDEEGTVAAAVTGGFMMTAKVQRPPKDFNANHPFMFFLKHKQAGIFFIGRYSAPEGEVIALQEPLN